MNVPSDIVEGIDITWQEDSGCATRLYSWEKCSDSGNRDIFRNTVGMYPNTGCIHWQQYQHRKVPSFIEKAYFGNPTDCT
jgi:hypothetical protein